MLVLLSVNMTGLFSYGWCEDVPLTDQGLTWLHGINQDKDASSNGAGKTSLFNSITQVLFGKAESYVKGTLTAADDVINAVWGKGCCARVTWRNHRGETWRLTYSRKWKTPDCPYPKDSPLWPFSGTDLYLEAYVETDLGVGTWQDRRAAEMPATRKRCQAAVGLSYERYLACTYLAQGRGFDFLKGTHAQRMGILTDAVQLSIWDDAVQKYRDLHHIAQEKLKPIQLQVSHYQGQLAALSVMPEAVVIELQKELGTAIEHQDHYRVKRDDAYTESAINAAAIQSVKAGKNPALAALHDLELKHGTWAAKYQNKIPAVQASLDQLTMNVSKEKERIRFSVDDDLVAAQYEIQRVHLVYRELEDLLLKIKQGLPVDCPTCGSKSPNPEHVQQDMVKASALIGDRTRQLMYVSAVAERKRTAASLALEMYFLEREAAFLEDLRALQFEADEWMQIYEAKKAELLAQSKEQNSGVLLADLEAKQKELDTVRWTLEHSYQDVASKAARLKYQIETDAQHRATATSLTAALGTLQQEFVSINRDVLEYAWLIKYSGDKGFKSWKIASVTARLNTLLAEALHDLDAAFQVTCLPYRPKAGCENKPYETLTSDEIVPEFTIYIKEGSKVDVPSSMYSGGEISLVAFALLIAFWRLTDELGQGTNLLLLDEAVGAFDGRNAGLVTNFIEGLKSSGKSVFVVSHNSFVASLDFDQTWTAVKTHGISTLQRS